jgi:hypothetical protein
MTRRLGELGTHPYIDPFNSADTLYRSLPTIVQPLFSSSREQRSVVNIVRTIVQRSSSSGEFTKKISQI